MANEYKTPEGSTEKARQVLIDVDFKEGNHRIVAKCAAFGPENNVIIRNTGSVTFSPAQAIQDGKFTQEEVEQFDVLLSKMVDVAVEYKQGAFQK